MCLSAQGLHAPRYSALRTNIKHGFDKKRVTPIGLCIPVKMPNSGSEVSDDFEFVETPAAPSPIPPPEDYGVRTTTVSTVFLAAPIGSQLDGRVCGRFKRLTSTL